jgi:GNAT superfamily N-acetyltransferase
MFRYVGQAGSGPLMSNVRPHMNLGGVTVQRIFRTPETLASVQALVEGAPEYSRLTSGAEPESSAAASIFDALPPGKTYEAKYVLAVCLNDKQVGVVDLIRDFPIPSCAMLGLLLLSDRHQGSGLGRSTYMFVEQLVRTWPEVKRVRIGVVETNARVLPFWQRMGFKPTGETRPYSVGTVVSRVLVLEQSLQSAA